MIGLAFGVVVAGAATARAGATGTSDVACSSSSVRWNVPNGGVAFIAGDGTSPVGAVINDIGERRTHSITSHGGSYVTHSTMYTPGTEGWPTYCSTPVQRSQLREGWPGLSQINQGGLYQYLYGGGAPELLEYIMPTGSEDRALAEQQADWLWIDSDYRWVSSKQDSGAGFWQVGISNSNGWYDQPYVLYQYRDLQNRHIGWQWTPMYNGAHCSTQVAWALYKATAQSIAPKTYDHDTIVSAGNALYHAVKNECNDETGFWTDVGAAITCFEGICDDAGRQVRNCMARGICDSDDSDHWKAVVNDPAANATSISPDCLGGFNDCNSGPWAPYGAAPVTWSSAGNVYGCWF